jgi:hypothetical protein
MDLTGFGTPFGLPLTDMHQDTVTTSELRTLQPSRETLFGQPLGFVRVRGRSSDGLDFPVEQAISVRNAVWGHGNAMPPFRFPAYSKNVTLFVSLEREPDIR